MNKVSKSDWTRRFEETVDQRTRTLPPTWIANVASEEPLSEWGDAVHESGHHRAVARELVHLLEQAREMAIVSSYLLADEGLEDALLDAANRGVRVYVLLASEARLGREPGEGEFDQKVLAGHKAMLQRLGGHVLFRTAGHFHAKLLLIDPDSAPAGLLLTANLTREALERNEELAVSLTPAEVREARGYLAWALWEVAEHELLDDKDFRVAKPLGRVPHPEIGSTVVATTHQTNGVRDAALELIGNAKMSIIVSSFGWDENHEVVRRLRERAREGLDVTVLARLRRTAMPALIALAEAGAKVHGFRWLHAKAIMIDGEVGMVMSANLEPHGLDQGFELGVRLTGERVRELERRLVVWSQRAPWRLDLTPELGAIRGNAHVWVGGELREVKVTETMELDLGEVIAESADRLDAPRPGIPEDGSLPHLAHELRCSWRVAAPKLSPQAKEVFQPTQEDTDAGQKGKSKQTKPRSYAPSVFRESSGEKRLLIAVRSPNELPQADQLQRELKADEIVVLGGGTS